MQTRREQLGYEMTLLPPLESLIPAEHRLRKLNSVLDLSFVHEVVRDQYSQDSGRPSIDPPGAPDNSISGGPDLGPGLKAHFHLKQ